ncbi:glycogen debranching protein GlgX [Sinomonas sp. ASV486]|uniref:glycogen debranching protein GlgX n=1 Tax=Sinomonas sp. ASV486 TaxID=3051170 RepID=UPI0027DB134D|nr:glycogen debranching protein GlgX [Sinomonas sp. ASV486]MDQ4489132.1 glycogen debranching protein GlgX [Sinomonas sp. ASV486]
MEALAEAPGHAAALGATLTESGADFALLSTTADAVDLCLLDESGVETRYPMSADRGLWTARVPGVRAGQRYGYRVDGPWDPNRGLRHNPHKLLLDPYAKAIDGRLRWGPEMYAFDLTDPSKPDRADNRDKTFLSVVVDTAYDWGKETRPRTPFNRTVIYEAHVKGLTKLHPDVPVQHRGTYAGLAHPSVVAHLKRIGVTAVELLPVQQFVNDEPRDGRSNYWGYNPIGYFAPHNAYAAACGSREPVPATGRGPERRAAPCGGQVAEFKDMVKTLHEAGIEVFLDVVYNHSGEGGADGPNLCFRGIDNAAYYHLVPGDEANYEDYTGTHNTLNVGSPTVLRMVMDSLRYWVQEMHVDGFRFDLAPALARASERVDMLSTLLELMDSDPVLEGIKLIAEPWDLGPDGYQLGNFPPRWVEWNGRFRDVVRDFWRGKPGVVAELAKRLTGSADLYQDDGRQPSASVNFVTAHDGLTLRDLVSYNSKHNAANGQGDSDGESDNHSWNCGIEGPTQDPEITALRARQTRNLMISCVLAQGVPMLRHGDELGHTQEGNNNAYCQDNPISWIDWASADEDLIAFTSKLVRLRHDYPVFRRRTFFDGRPVAPAEGIRLPDILWLNADGTPRTENEWGESWSKSLACYLSGKAVRTRPNEPENDFLVVLNASSRSVLHRAPNEYFPAEWEVVLTSWDGPVPTRILAGSSYSVPGRTAWVLRSIAEPATS